MNYKVNRRLKMKESESDKSEGFIWFEAYCALISPLESR